MKRSLLAAVLVLLAGCSAPQTTQLPPFPSPTNPPTTNTASAVSPPGPTLAVFAYTVPPRVTGAQAPACVARGQLPDPACTPGSVGASASDATVPASQAEVCNAGFENKHRPSPTLAAKRAAMKAYHLVDADLPRTEYDHLIPLSLGGSNHVTNLWPQVSDLPGKGFRNSKDGVELRLWRAACTGDPAHRVPLADVQAAFARDWTSAEKFLGLAPA